VVCLLWNTKLRVSVLVSSYHVWISLPHTAEYAVIPIACTLHPDNTREFYPNLSHQVLLVCHIPSPPGMENPDQRSRKLHESGLFTRTVRHGTIAQGADCSPLVLGSVSSVFQSAALEDIAIA